MRSCFLRTSLVKDAETRNETEDSTGRRSHIFSEASCSSADCALETSEATALINTSIFKELQPLPTLS